jgi:hypothetical protein
MTSHLCHTAPYWEDYFMTEEDKAHVVGTAMIAYKEISEQIAAFRIQSDQIGEKYAQIAAGLRSHPEGVHPRQEGIDTRFTNLRVAVTPEGFPTVSDVFALTDKIRKALIRQQELEAQLVEFGIPKR